MSTVRRRKPEPNEYGFDEQAFTRALRGSPLSVVGDHDDRTEPEHDERDVPLFLTDPHGRPQPSEYAQENEDEDYAPLRRRSAIPRLVVAGLAVVALGGAGAAFHGPILDFLHDAASGKLAAAPKSSSALVASADASSLSAQDIAAVPPPKPVKEQGRLGDPVVRPQASAPAAAPSREAVNSAYQNAWQSQGAQSQTAPAPQAAAPAPAPQIAAPQIQTSAPAPSPAPSAQIAAAAPFPAPQGSVAAPAAAPSPWPAAEPAREQHRLSADQIASLIKRGDDLVGSGDVAAARLVLRKAAEAGDARAMIKMGATYDPALLSRIDNHGVAPDLAAARTWYERAARTGNAEAAQRLQALASARR